MKLVFVFFLLTSIVVIPSAMAQDGECPAVTADTSQLAEDRAFLAENNIPTDFVRDLSASPEGSRYVSLWVESDQFKEFLADPDNYNQLTNILDTTISQDLIDQAIAVLSRYGMGQGDIGPLMAVQSNKAALFESLTGRGLDAGQIESFLGEIAPIVAEANKRDHSKYMLTYGASDALLDVGFIHLGEVADIINDPVALEAYFAENGYDPALYEPALDELAVYGEMGLDANLIGLLQAEESLQELERVGLPADALDDLAAMSADPAAVEACLIEMGLEAEDLDLVLAHLEDNLISEDGNTLTLEELEAAQDAEAWGLLEEAGTRPEQLGDILALRGDDAAMTDYLLEYGFSEDATAEFISNLDNTTFSETLTDDDVLEFVDDVEAYEGPSVDFYDMEDDQAQMFTELDELDPEQIDTLVTAVEDGDFEALDELLASYGIDDTSEDDETIDSDNSDVDGEDVDSEDIDNEDVDGEEDGEVIDSEGDATEDGTDVDVDNTDESDGSSDENSDTGETAPGTENDAGGEGE